VIARLLAHADSLYDKADLGVPLLPRDSRAAIRAARLIYAEIGREVARAGHDAMSRRAVVPGRRKLFLALRALFPLRGERGERALPALAETQFLVDAALPRPLLGA
jgi:phytoene synthase